MSIIETMRLVRTKNRQADLKKGSGNETRVDEA